MALANPLQSSPKYPTHWADPDPESLAEVPLSGWQPALYAVAEVLFATAEGPPPPGRTRWLCHRTREMIGDIGGNGALLFRASLSLVSWTAPLMALRAPTLRRLSFDERVEALERYERSPLGMTLFALKAMLCIHYFEHPDVITEIDFDTRCRTEARGGQR